MKLYILDDYKKEKKKKLNKKKLVKTIVIAITIIVLIVLAAFYIGNEKFRGFIDRYVLQKEITENTGNIIQISQEDNPYVYTYDKYITVLNKNLLEHYNSNANLEFSVKVSISTPLFASNGKYLVLAEKGGQKLYLISGQNIIWQKDIEGNIVNVNVNKNGYVSIIITGTIYKTIICTYDVEGNDLPMVYRSWTYAIDTDISSDNKNLAFAEINSTGSIIQSSIKIISLEVAKTNPSESEIYSYEGNPKELINCIKYQDGENLVGMFDNRLILVKDNQVKTILEFGTDTIFADINLTNNFIKVEKKSTGIFSSESNIEIGNINNDNKNLYKIQGIPKSIITRENIIAISLWTDIHFIRNQWMAYKKIYFYKRNKRYCPLW